MRRTIRIALLALVVIALLPGGVAAQSPSPSAEVAVLPSGGPGASSLRDSLEYAPPGTTTLGFTDWSAVRHALGADDVTGDSPIDDKLQVLLETNKSQAAASGFALSRLRDHRDVWGWDTMDLDWEAVLTFDAPPTYVLRFRDGFDLTNVESRFEERGFTRQEVDGATVWSHEMDLSTDWMTSSEFAILNTAFLPDGRTLVLSSSVEAVEDVLTWLADPGARPASDLAVTAALSGASAAFLQFGAGTCTGFSPVPLGMDPDEAERVLEQFLETIKSTGPLHPYFTLGVGYSGEWPTTGRIAFGYADPATAAEDLEGRRTLADTGVSLRVQQPYAEAVFTVSDASADENGVLLLAVEPVDNIPQRLFQMVYARDLLFGVCSE
jgi:hypothetical protein